LFIDQFKNLRFNSGLIAIVTSNDLNMVYSEFVVLLLK